MQATVGAFPACDRRRSQRYPVAARVRFRVGDGEWQDASTVNMSGLGVLMRVRGTAPAVSTELELRIALTADGVRSCAHVACAGRVVRVDPQPSPGEVGVAVALERSELEPIDRTELLTFSS